MLMENGKWGEIAAWGKIAVVWAGNYLTLTNLNSVLSTLVLIMTVVFTYFQIDKLLREREAALQAKREAALAKAVLDALEKKHE